LSDWIVWGEERERGKRERVRGVEKKGEREREREIVEIAK
jgi:hypothetical protein